MKLHHFLTILCVVFFIGFVTMTAIYFDLGKDVLALEKEIETITAERDQLTEEIEILNNNLENQKSVSEEELKILKAQLSHIQEQYNKLYDETTPEREYPNLLEKAFEDAKKGSQP